ncbi:MAG: hypothetical protein GX417_04945 [Clostridiales bacterium]|nr:hypothetical protein [Clostridiales bacterium]
MKKNILRQAVDGEDVFGVYLSIPSPTMVEICKFAGFDYVRLDMEHSLYSPSEIRECLRTAHALELPAWVRVSSLSNITALLDMGATGIIVPDIKSKKQVKEAVEMVKYAPVGARGMMPSGRTLRFGLDPIAPVIETANDEICLVVQIESLEALNDIDEILSVEGLDMVSMGKQDMSQSLGIAGQGGHPRVVEAENLQIQKTIAAGKYPAPLVTSLARMKAFREMGVHNFTIGYDVALMIGAFSDLLKKHKEC